MIETLCEAPVPVYLARTEDFCPPKWLDDWFTGKSREWIGQGATKWIACRGTSLDRLPRVIELGTDVPLGQPLWADTTLQKAYEYGGRQKLVLVLAGDALQQSFRVLPLDTPEHELEVLKKEYPTVLRQEDRGEIYLSRLDPKDSRVGTAYEAAYCYFPIGDPRNSLIALIVILPPDADLEPIKATLAAHQDCDVPTRAALK